MLFDLGRRLFARGGGGAAAHPHDTGNGWPSANAQWRPTHRHRKGGEYRVLAYGILETDRSDAVIYDDAAGTIWVRPLSEFNDGRFLSLIE